MAITACGGSAEQEPEQEPPPPLAPIANSAPLIGGAPPATARIGEAYTFRPTASDSNDDTLRFTATRLPRWASLDPNNGRLTGTPRPGDEGVYSGITIRVSDGRADAALPAFSIEVSQYATGNATLSWDAPTRRFDDSVLNNLAGYRVEYGRDADDPDHFMLIDNPSINTVVIDNLSTGTWYFVVVALDSRSLESLPSARVSRTIQ